MTSPRTFFRVGVLDSRLRAQSPGRIPSMLSTRYRIAVTNRRTEEEFRFSVSIGQVLGAVAVAAVLPALLVLGARYKAEWEQRTIRAELANLREENALMRDATTSLTSQITALQSVLDDVSQLTPTPVEAKAMARLPHDVRRHALGGLSPEAARTALAGPAPGTEAVNVLNQMLSAFQSRLETARPQLAQRAALARATPSIWPALGPLTSSYGSRRDPFTLAASMHPGLDVGVDHGDPVHATADGVVIDSRYHHEYGNLVTVWHGFGIETRYAHLSRRLVPTGTSVTRGQMIGEAGSTGRSTGSHVHYEVWIHGRPVNPLQYLVGRQPTS